MITSCFVFYHTESVSATEAAAAAPLAVKTVDLVIFAGQSNMSGRGGNAKAAPAVPVDTGYESIPTDICATRPRFAAEAWRPLL